MAGIRVKPSFLHESIDPDEILQSSDLTIDWYQTSK